MKVAQNYNNAAEIMLEYKNEEKAKKLLEKARQYAKKTNNADLITKINNSLSSTSTLPNSVMPWREGFGRREKQDLGGI